MAVGPGETGIDDKAAAVLHQRMAHEAKLGFPAGLLRKSRASGSVVLAWVSLLRVSP